MSYLFNNKIDFVDGQVDAFRRLRVANPQTLFDSTNQYDETPLLWVTSANGTANADHHAPDSAVHLHVGSTAGDKIIRQTREYFRYQPGKSQLILTTIDYGTTDANNVSKSVGYFDDDNGIYFKRYANTNSWVLRSSSSGSMSETVVDQANWNLDTFDGNGPSGITLDATKSAILIVDLEWLGVG